jgi:hypothetical protein
MSFARMASDRLSSSTLTSDSVVVIYIPHYTRQHASGGCGARIDEVRMRAKVVY